MKLLLKSVLSLLIAAQIIAAPLLAHADQGVVTPAPSADDLYGDTDPLWQEFQQAKPTSDFKFAFDAKDPAIDQDPFFLRSQSWVRKTQSKDLGYIRTAKDITIELPEAEEALRLELPLVPIQATDDYVFFSLDKSSDLFAKAAGPGEAAGEGLFFISRHELNKDKPTQVYFYPFAGTGWTGPLDSVELAQTNALVVANEKESVALDLEDVETVMKAEQLNLLMAVTMTSKNRDDVVATPARGSTGAFGMFFTGLDLEQPSKSLWAAAPHGATDRLIAKLGDIVHRYFPVERADALDPVIASRLLYVGTALTGMMFASIVIKNKNPMVRKELDKRLTPQTSRFGAFKQEVRETLDVFSAVTTTSAQLPSITFANSLELFLDRFAPTLAASDHTLVRRFLKNTFYFSRNAIENTPVNAKTFALGALLMGGVDSACVAIQYIWAVPTIAAIASKHVVGALRDRINTTFDPNNAQTKTIALQDIVRTFLAWLLSGASSYSSEARTQQIEQIEKEVDSNLRARGIDPADPSHQTERRHAVEERMNVVLKQKGLPDADQFLFDANTVFSQLPKSLGFKAPQGLATAETFVLQKRFGLSKNAVNRSLAAAKAWAAQESSPLAAEVVAILQETAGNMDTLRAGLKDGRKGVLMSRLVHKELTLLSYEGAVSIVTKHVPLLWRRHYSPEAAQAASVIFRQALFSYLRKEGDALVIANKKQMDEFGTRAREIAREQLLADHPGTKTLTSAMEYELKLRTQIEITKLVEAKETEKAASDYQPPKLDWLARRQQARAIRNAEERLDQYLNSPAGYDATDEDVQTMRNNFVRDAFAREVGLHLDSASRPEYVAMMAKVDQKTTDGLKAQIAGDPKLETYLATLSEPEKAKALSVMYANDFLANYKEATTEQEMVKPLDVAQPGRLQALRRTQIFRSSSFLTRAARTFEAFGDDQNLKLGWYGRIARNIPLANDLISTHRRALKTILSSMTINYAWNYYVWHVHMPYSAWMIFAVGAASTISTPSQWLNRVFRVNGLKPMNAPISKLKFALAYSWVTFAGMFPVLMYQKDASVWFSDYITAPIMSVMDHVDPKMMFAALAVGAGAVAIKKVTKKLEFSGARVHDWSDLHPLMCAEIFGHSG